MLHIGKMLAAKPAPHEEQQRNRLVTSWGEELLARPDVVPRAEHPHPQFARASWTCLNGWWDYAIVAGEDLPDREGALVPPEQFDARIRVPFSPETELSGVERTLQPGDFLWYRRSVAADELPHVRVAQDAECPDEHMILHFEAVDHTCACFVNGVCVGVHEGGYLPFSYDVTSRLHDGDNEISLCVVDPSDAGVQLRGKQSLRPGDIWYAAQSGIWQPVWLEAVPAIHVASAQINAAPDLETGAGVVAVRALIDGLYADQDDSVQAEPVALAVRLYDAEGTCIAEAAGDVSDGIAEVSLRAGKVQLWSPENPYLYELQLVCGADNVRSYCAFRSCAVKRADDGHMRFFLNGKPLLLRGVLDQGYWPDGLMTAPSDEAFVFDIKAMRDAGFNFMRKHIKIEAERWYYHCDRLGMLVWQDMVSGGSALDTWVSSYQPSLMRASWTRYEDTSEAHCKKLSSEDEQYRAEWRTTCDSAITQLGNHPCIVTWVLFNEGWGQFESNIALARARQLDPTRPIDAVSGWYDQGLGDWHDVHNYFRDLEVWQDRAGEKKGAKRAFALGEFGGLTFAVEGHSLLDKAYGYAAYDDQSAWRRAFDETIAQADALEGDGLAAWVYTQLSDVEEETNGLITYDRRVNKLDCE